MFIPTDAHQLVSVYGSAKNKMPEVTEDNFCCVGFQDDAGYGLHFSSSSSTLGCGRIGSQQEALDSTNGVSYLYVHE